MNTTTTEPPLSGQVSSLPTTGSVESASNNSSSEPPEAVAGTAAPPAEAPSLPPIPEGQEPAIGPEGGAGVGAGMANPLGLPPRAPPPPRDAPLNPQAADIQLNLAPVNVTVVNTAEGLSQVLPSFYTSGVTQEKYIDI